MHANHNCIFDPRIILEDVFPPIASLNQKWRTFRAATISSHNWPRSESKLVFSGVLKKRHVGLCSKGKRYLFRRTVEEAPRAGCWSHRVKNRSCQQLWQWSVLLHCALCTSSKVAQAWSPQCKCAHNGPLWWLPPLLGLQSSCRAAFVSGGAAPPRPRPGDQWAPWQEGRACSTPSCSPSPAPSSSPSPPS